MFSHKFRRSVNVLATKVRTFEQYSVYRTVDTLVIYNTQQQSCKMQFPTNKLRTMSCLKLRYPDK